MADALSMVRQRAETIIEHLEEGTAPCFQVVQECRELVEDASLAVPSWTELSVSRPQAEEDPEPNQPRHGWQKATRQLEKKFLSDVVPGLHDSRRAMANSVCLATIVQRALRQDTVARSNNDGVPSQEGWDGQAKSSGGGAPSLQPKLEVGETARRRSSSKSWPEDGHRKSHWCCKAVRTQLI